MTAAPGLLPWSLRSLSRLSDAAARVAGGSLALPLVRLSGACARMADRMKPARPEALPASMPAATAARDGSHGDGLRIWPMVRTTGLSILWLWRIVTAPIRLVVWVAEAIVTLSMAAILVGAAAWMGGLVPDEWLLRIARPLTEKMAGLLSHALGGGP